MKKYAKILLLFFLAATVVTGIVWETKDKKERKTVVQSEKAIQNENERCQEFVLGLISDIHAGNERERVIEGVTYNYPNKYDDFFSVALDQMKEKKVDLVVVAGDNTNKGKSKYAKVLKRISDEKGIPAIWTKGNHDRYENNTMSHLGVNNPYYFQEHCGWRFVVLDTGTHGTIEEDQMNWFKKTLETENKVIVVMHHPLWDQEKLEKIPDGWRKTLERTMAESGRVKHVIGGHYHINYWHKFHNGVEYHILPSFTQEKDRPLYEIIKL